MTTSKLFAFLLVSFVATQAMLKIDTDDIENDKAAVAAAIAAAAAAGNETPLRLSFQEVQALFQKDATNKDPEQCADTTVAGDVWIMTSNKNYLFCSVEDDLIAMVSTTTSNQESPLCVWRMNYCTSYTNYAYSLFSHYNGGVVKWLLCYSVGSTHTCMQTDLYGASGWDNGQFMKMASVTGGQTMYANLYAGYVRNDGTQLQLGGGAATVFKICFTNIGLLYC